MWCVNGTDLHHDTCWGACRCVCEIPCRRMYFPHTGGVCSILLPWRLLDSVMDLHHVMCWICFPLYMDSGSLGCCRIRKKKNFLHCTASQFPVMREKVKPLTYFFLRCSLILARFGASLRCDVYVSVVSNYCGFYLVKGGGCYGVFKGIWSIIRWKTKTLEILWHCKLVCSHAGSVLVQLSYILSYEWRNSSFIFTLIKHQSLNRSRTENFITNRLGWSSDLSDALHSHSATNHLMTSTCSLVCHQENEHC